VKRSVERILTTHVGSLPRPNSLLHASSSLQLSESVAEVVARQAELGLDVVSDGEFGKPSFVGYIGERLSGLEVLAETRPLPWSGSREALAFPAYYGRVARESPSPAASTPALVCSGAVGYVGQEALRVELENLRAALVGVEVEEAFVPAVSPGNAEAWVENRWYASSEEYLFALAEALRVEYLAIVDAGFLLQVDDPQLLTYYVEHPGVSVEECRGWARVRIEALNHALRGIPPERVRFHTCYGINIGPRLHDLELREVIDLMLAVEAGAYSFEAANPRHEHEWRVWSDVELPEGKLLIPGVVTNSSVMVEHPDVVADRIERFAGVVGRERVIAGADCGFASFAGSQEFDPGIVWAKLASLVEGARRASARLWASG
jgi:5-methyltetrahydropteroyltriglutamate--homocysteine methyltransferase